MGFPLKHCLYWIMLFGVLMSKTITSRYKNLFYHGPRVHGIFFGYVKWKGRFVVKWYGDIYPTST